MICFLPCLAPSAAADKIAWLSDSVPPEVKKSPLAYSKTSGNLLPCPFQLIIGFHSCLMQTGGISVIFPDCHKHGIYGCLTHFCCSCMICINSFILSIPRFCHRARRITFLNLLVSSKGSSVLLLHHQLKSSSQYLEY